MTKQIQVTFDIHTVIVEWGESKFYQYSVRGKSGTLFAFPFFTDEEFKGYLVYHDKNSYGFNYDGLRDLGLKSLYEHNLSGTVGGMFPLPYKLVGRNEIESLLDSLIVKNSHVDLTKCYL